MANFLFRGYNAAIPEIDVGDDLFVVTDATGELFRIQVKSTIAKGVNSRRGRFHVPCQQLKTAQSPDLYFVFAFHFDALWRTFIVISRESLTNLHTEREVGRRDESRGSVYFDVVVTDTTTTCNGVSLQECRDNWNPWPIIAH
jgi:hypothetical protein